MMNDSPSRQLISRDDQGTLCTDPDNRKAIDDKLNDTKKPAELIFVNVGKDQVLSHERGRAAVFVDDTILFPG